MSARKGWRVTCPACHVEVTSENCADLTLDAVPRAPRPGDLAICPACLAVAVVALDGQLVAPTPAQMAAIPPKNRVVLDAVQSLRGRGGPS